MSREVHVRFCEGAGVKLPRATRRNIYVRSHRGGQAGHGLGEPVPDPEAAAEGQPVEKRRGATGGAAVLGLHPSRTTAANGASRVPRAQPRSRRGSGRSPAGHGGLSGAQRIEEPAPYLIGWRGYFGFCQTPRVLTNLEAWIRRRLRSYLWRQWQNGHNRAHELRRRGVPKFNAAVAAGSPTG